MFRELALMAWLMWLSFPIFLIPIHLASRFWRRLGVFTYAVLFVVWLPIAFLLLLNQNLILGQELQLSSWFLAAGLLLLVLGFAIHLWTAKLLGIKSLIGYGELYPEDKGCRLITSGPFSIVRHPTYIGHTLLLLGAFFTRGYSSVALLSLIDFLITYFVIIELEEKELIGRFGDDYREYKKKFQSFSLVQA